MLDFYDKNFKGGKYSTISSSKITGSTYEYSKNAYKNFQNLPSVYSKLILPKNIKDCPYLTDLRGPATN